MELRTLLASVPFGFKGQSDGVYIKNNSSIGGKMSTKTKPKAKPVATTKKPVYKQWWFWVIIVFALQAIGAVGSTKKGDEATNGSSETTTQTTETPKTTDTPKTTEDTTTDTTPSMTVSQRNALRSAQSYLDYSAFSYSGLIKQLEYEKYSHEDAVFAADNCGADWNEQAVKSAKSYLEYSAFSHDGLVSQLEYEGFTHEQAEYGATQNGL